MADWFLELSEIDLTSLVNQMNILRKRWWSNDNHLLSLVITKYRNLSMYRRLIIDLLVTDKSRSFSQPRPIIVNVVFHCSVDKRHGFVTN